MHTEKQKIFDEYAKSVSSLWTDFDDLFKTCIHNGNLNLLINHIYKACDLVQNAQQRRIAQKATVKHTEFKPEKVSGSSRAIGNGSQVFSVDQSSILSENNLIK